MAISDTQKVDLLYKKYFGVTKTDLATNKSPSNEAIASPALSRIDQLWTQAASIPSTAAATAGIVQAYTGASAVQCTADTTTTPISSVYPSWKTNLTDWIPSEFGSTYFVQVWVDSSGVGNPTATGTQIFDSGSGGTGEWNFDYKAGVLNFIGGTIPAVLTSSKVIYIVGYRYIGLKATNFGNATIGNINISGNTITGNSSGITFGSNIYVGNIFYSNGSPFISGGGSSFGNADVLANLAANSAANITVFGNITGTYFVGNAFYLTGLAASYSNLNVASYLLTNTGNISAGNLLVQSRVYANTISSNGGNVVTVSGTGALGLPVGSTGQRPISSSTGYIRYNTDESTVEYFNGTDWTPVTNVVIDQAITGDGSTKTFTLTQSATAIGLLVSINGVIQNPNTGSYTVTGNQITFAEAPLSTDSVDIRFIASLTSVPGTISNDLTIYGNLTVSGNIIANTGIYTYGNVQVAQYLAANPQTGTYSNVNVAAYLSANPQGGIYSNTNVAAYLTTQTFYSNTNVAAYLSTASITASSIANGGSSLSFTGSGGDAVFQIGGVQTMTFGQTSSVMIGSIGATANVSGVNFLGNVIGTTASYSGNVTAGNITATQYGNSIGTSATYSGNITAGNIIATQYGNSVGTTARYTGNVTAANFIGNIVNTSGTTTLTGNVQTGNLTVTGNLISTGYGFFPGAFQESSTLSGVFVGNTGSAGGQTPRIAFYNGNVSQNWQIDNFNGALRFFTPGVTRASIDGNTNQLSVYGNVSTTGQLLSFMGTANSDNQLVLQGNVYKGGAGYHDFLRVTSTYSSVTNPNKFFRLNSTGGLEIVNSAYNATIFTMTDGGDTTIAGNLTVNGINSGYAPNRPAFRVYGNSNTGWTPSSPTSGIMTSGQFSVDFNQGSYLNTSTGVFTAPVAGLYQVNLTARTNANNSGVGSAIQIQKNGSSIVYLEWAANTSTNHIGGGTVIKLAVGDTLKMVVSSGTVNFDVNDSWSVAYLG